jgi:hypothetical protein
MATLSFYSNWRNFLVCFLAFFSSYALGAKLDFGAGVAQTSTGMAPFLNPSGLLPGGEKSFQFGILCNNEIGFSGAFSGQVQRRVGWGIGFQKQGTLYSLTPALAVSLGSVSIGFSTNISIYSLTQNQLALTYISDTTGVDVALVSRDAFYFRSWSMGLGMGRRGRVRFAWDFDFYFSQGFNINSLYSTATITIVPINELSLLVRGRATLIPTFSFTTSNLEFGANYWFTTRLAAYGLYNDSLSNLVLGMQALF